MIIIVNVFDNFLDTHFASSRKFVILYFALKHKRICCKIQIGIYVGMLQFDLKWKTEAE